ncbi:hypothetical protein FB451DRAFT_1185623 [Mycena latifolia]|nr:hypothetical protein FB451DRAFT_1185623 [Mycena latifolia]
MNEASDRVSDAEAARLVLEVYRGESPSSIGIGSSAVPRRSWTLEIGVEKAMPRLLQVHPQVRRGCPQAQLGSTVEERARICNARSEIGLNAREDRARCRILGRILDSGVVYSCALEMGPGCGDIRVETRVEATSSDVSCCVGGCRRRVVPPSGVDSVAVVVREAAADEPRLGKFPYADS